MIWTDGEEGQNGTWNEEHDIYERGKGKKEDGQKFIQSIYLSIYLSICRSSLSIHSSCKRGGFGGFEGDCGGMFV